MSHLGEHCQECKENLPSLLTNACGKIEKQYSLKIKTHIEDYSSAIFGRDLQIIYEALSEFRGHKKLVRDSNLRPSDFFAGEAGFIIEFDEAQHFTEPRAISLQNYPRALSLGFNRERWLEMCTTLNIRMNKKLVPYRDEQRAWLDTLRDFAPIFLDLKPTRRLRASDRIWCELDPTNPEVIADIRCLLTL